MLWWWGGDYGAFSTRMQIQTALLCYSFQWNTSRQPYCVMASNGLPVIDTVQ